jgi:hypothetical protein
MAVGYQRNAIRVLSIVGFCALVACVRKTDAAIEIPVTIIGNYPAFGGFDVGYFIDNNTATDYSSAFGGTATHVDFQLPGIQLVGSAVYTDRTSSGGGNGSLAGGPFDNVTSFSLIFSNDPSFSTILWTENYSSPGYANTDPPSLVNGGNGVPAQYVRWQVTSAAGGNTGGAEIHFFTSELAAVPELSSAVVWLIALCGAGGCRALSRK